MAKAFQLHDKTGERGQALRDLAEREHLYHHHAPNMTAALDYLLRQDALIQQWKKGDLSDEALLSGLEKP